MCGELLNRLELFADRTSAFELSWGANWHRLSSDLLRVIRLSLRVYSLVDSSS